MLQTLRHFALWLSQAHHLVHSDDPDPVVSVPLTVNGYVVWFYDDSPTHLTPWPHPRAHYNTSLYGVPGHRLWLTPAPPVPISIAAWFCPSCGRPQVPAASIQHPPPPSLLLPNAMCLHPYAGRTHLTADVARRSHVRPPGLPLLHGVPAAPVRPGASCFHPDHTLLLPSPPWALHQHSLAFSPLHLRRHAGLVFLSWNIGGVASHVDFVVHVLLALEVDCFALQELWTFEPLLLALPSGYAYHTSSAEGCGTGFMIGWRRSLQHPATKPRVEHDAPDLLASTVRHHTIGFILLAPVHVHPHLDYKARRAVLLNLTTLAAYLRAALELIGGDFNMSRESSRNPLAAACRGTGCMLRFRPAFPADTPTHFSSSQGVHTATCIDHVFTRGARSIPDADVLPSPTPHKPLLVTVEPMEGLTDIRSWRMIRWRHAPPGTLPRLAALVDLLWGWLSSYPVGPNAYLQSLWAAARRLIPHPRPLDHVLRDLRLRSAPRTDSDLADLREFLASTAARHGVERPDDVLRSTSITSATKGALCRPSKPLRPYSGILPDIGATLPSPSARLQEVHDQAAATTAHRGHTLDRDFLTAMYDPAKWDPHFDPIAHIPTPLLGDLLAAGLDPRDCQHRDLHSRSVAAGPVLRDDRVWASATTAGSLFAGLDQCPQALLHHLRHGGVQGVQHHLRLVDAGMDSLSLDSVMMGIDKGKPFPHLFKAHRPVTLTSPLTRTESRAARTMLVQSLEVSGALPPDAFAYRSDMRPAFLALSFRATVFSSLETHGTAAVTDWDSADAFLRQQREDCTTLHSILQLPWDFGPWAVKYYGRLRIHPLAEDGFAPPYVTEEGWNQGDNPSGDTYQVGELVVSGSLPHPTDVRVPPGPAGIPVSNLSYSDDRRLVRPTLPSLVALTRLCARATVAKGGLVHMDKLRFFALRLGASGPIQLTSPVPFYLTDTSRDCPQVVGIPLSHALQPPQSYADLAKQVQRMRLRIGAVPTNNILALRSLWAFALSQLDFIASGVAIPPEHIEDLAVQARAYYRQVLGLPCWVSRALMSLPPRYGGPGCPHLPLRTACHLLLTYAQATCSRSLLARQSALYLSSTNIPGSESHPLAAAAQRLSLQISIPPDSSVNAMPIHYDADPSILHAHQHLIVSTDAALRHHLGGGGVVFYAPTEGIILRAWYGLRVWATPTGMEWLARLVALHLLQGWQGCLTSALDGTSALHRAYTRFPLKLTILELIWRSLTPTLLDFQAHYEVWCPAQHDTQDTHLLALLNREAHQLAARGASSPTPWAVPLPQHLPSPLLLYYRGALLLEPQLGLDQAYDDAAAAAYFAGRRASCLRPDGGPFYDLLESDELPTRAIKRALAYRALEWQPPPDPNIAMECHFCGVTEHQLWRHVRSRCPAAYLHLLHARAQLLLEVTSARGATVTAEGALLDSDGRPVLQCSWDAHYVADHADVGNVLTLSGLWYHVPSDHLSDLSAAAKRRATRVVVSLLAQPALSLPMVLALWATLPCPLSSPDRPPPQPPAVTFRDPQSYVPWVYTLAAAYLVRGLVSWRVCSAGQLHLSLPVEPHWHPGPPVRLIVSPPEDLYWALALLAESNGQPPGAGVALLTAVPPGDRALTLPQPLQPFALGPLWLYATAGVGHRWALQPATGPTQ